MGNGPVTSRHAGTVRDENCRKTSIDITRSRRHAPIGREGYTKGATEQCRKMAIDITRSRRHAPIGREGYTKVLCNAVLPVNKQWMTGYDRYIDRMLSVCQGHL